MLKISMRAISVLVVVGVVAASCSTHSVSSLPQARKGPVDGVGPSFVSTTLKSAFDAGAQAEGARVFNVLFGFNLFSSAVRIKVVEGYKSIEKPVMASLDALEKAGATGVSVNSVTMGTAQTCSSAKVSSPCVVVSYSVIGSKKTITSNQVGYAVMSGGTWVVSRSSACEIAPPHTSVKWTESSC